MKILLIEGSDGVGKTTLTKALSSQLPNSVIHRTPGQTDLGKVLRAIIKTTTNVELALKELLGPIKLDITPDVAQLLMLVDLFDYSNKVLDHSKTDYVILDRIPIVSGVIYGDATGADIEMIKKIGPMMFKHQIDHMFILSTDDYELLTSRIDNRGHKDLFEVDSVQKRVVDSYNSDFYITEYFNNVLNGTKITRLDAANSIQDNVQTILDIIL